MVNCSISFQLVVCSTTSLKELLGLEAYEEFEKIFAKDNNVSTDSDLVSLSSAFTYLLQGMLEDETTQVSIAKAEPGRIRMLCKWNIREVEEMLQHPVLCLRHLIGMLS
ncbi:hypothetical protein Gasu2_15550 [Galdieria sulphuraria]|uniref:Uncharacterized protein n=1 Tax=Galdieria sulphuraria TaxID=130081 RepID=M2WRQ7_GALSU|nr:uncharacterized protein Gasu_58350 [Galdieria sulphuraria]EME26510.1 hypothetical protein Gasu_58350 [Galdieria sulphuraria]GJD07181.1 hypothetical protein Gasu2_15550 [Galdieria sulphuraria]|eukprot:XP_005703030.1 hypothetical protein Gasu_58350 [Galdieria sulphuraria]